MSQGVLEGIFDVTRRWLLVNKLARLQNVQQSIKRVGRQLHNLTGHRESEL